jgi:alpha-glucosidase
MKDDLFVKNPDGSVYVGMVWPGESVFPDFTLTRAREWWGGLYKDFVGMGAAGFWNDMDEPAHFQRADKTMPLDTVHRLDDGTTLDHRAIHNIFGLENVRATYEGLLKLQPQERPFVLTRAAYSGAQRYAATWTGDNSSTWNHLKMSTPMLLSMGISGFPLIGDDIGGFAGSPTADLLTRWFEVGALNPIFRDHTGKGTADQEPWVHGPEQEAIRRKYVELRYRLMPYIYTITEESTQAGIPLMRPIFLEYPQAAEFYRDDHDFLLGPDLFVSPVVSEMVDAQGVALPPENGLTTGLRKNTPARTRSIFIPGWRKCRSTSAPELSCPCNPSYNPPRKSQAGRSSCAPTCPPPRPAPTLQSTRVAARSMKMTDTPLPTRRASSFESAIPARSCPAP